MSMPGVPPGGLKTVGQIDATNPLVFYPEQNGMEVALALLSTTRPARRRWIPKASISDSSMSLMS